MASKSKASGRMGEKYVGLEMMLVKMIFKTTDDKNEYRNNKTFLILHMLNYTYHSSDLRDLNFQF